MGRLAASHRVWTDLLAGLLLAEAAVNKQTLIVSLVVGGLGPSSAAEPEIQHDRADDRRDHQEQHGNGDADVLGWLPLDRAGQSVDTEPRQDESADTEQREHQGGRE
jgi:hypothetical protein